MEKITLPEARFYPPTLEGKWDNIEIHGIWDDGESCEVTDDENDICYYSVYLHEVEGGVICIADFPTLAEAKVFYDILKTTVLSYHESGYLDKII